MKKYYDEINIARGIGILLVVLGHSFPSWEGGIKNEFFLYLFRFIYSFHMPLFFFLSGFVSYKLLVLKSSKEKINGIKSKLKRLIIPYLVISIPSLILKYMFADFAYRKFNFNNSILNIILGENPNGGLWFLYTLFTVSIIAIIFNKVNLKWLIGVFFVLAILPVGYPNIFKINRLCLNGIYYFLGIYINQNYELFKSKLAKRQYINISCILILVSNLVDINIRFIILLKALMGIYLTINLSILIVNHKNRVRDLLRVLGKYSYDIYLISYFIQIPIRIVLFNKMNFNYNFVVFSMFTFGLILPIWISKYIIRKNKIFKLLILGI